MVRIVVGHLVNEHVREHVVRRHRGDGELLPHAPEVVVGEGDVDVILEVRWVVAGVVVGG